MYVRGAKSFKVITDHKPLERIWQKAKPPLRIERWGLRLQPYKFSIEYRPGAKNPADYMSRHPDVPEAKATSREQKFAEHYVNFIAETSTFPAMSLEEVKSATSQDKTLMKANEYVRNGRWFEIKTVCDSEVDIKELQEVSNVREELSCLDNVLLRGYKIVLPAKLRNKAVSIAHEGHQGMNRTKSFISSKVWFPRLNEKVEHTVQNCLACQTRYAVPERMEPLNISEMPGKAWENLSMDFCGPLRSQRASIYLLVIVDEYSRYPVVEITKSVSANANVINLWVPTGYQN
jgi:hypothetical protein